MLAALEQNISDGAIAIVPVDWKEVHSTAEQLSSRYTTTGGHRTLDILHLATAIHLKMVHIDKERSAKQGGSEYLRNVLAAAQQIDVDG